MVVGVIDLNFIVLGRGLNLVVGGLIILCFVVSWVVVKLVFSVILMGFVVMVGLIVLLVIFFMVEDSGVFDVNIFFGGVLEVSLVCVLGVDCVIIVWVLVVEDVIDVMVL